MMGRLGVIAMSVALAGCASPVQERGFRSFEAEAARRRSDAGGAAAEKRPGLPEHPSLSDYLAHAALANPGLEAAFDRWKAAVERVPQARSLPDPRFTYAYFIREVETRVGPQRQKFGLAQTFPWIGTLELRGDAAAQAALAAHAEYEAAKLRLFYRVTDAYYEYHYLARAVSVAEEHVQLLTHLEEVARRRYTTGAATHADLIKAQVERDRLRDRLVTLRDLRLPLSARLAAAVNAPQEVLLDWPDSAPAPPADNVADQPIDDVLARLREGNPHLRSAEARIAGEKANIELARKEYFPDLTVGVEMMDTRDAFYADPPDSGTDPIVLMFSLNVPVWHEKYRAAESEARAKYSAAVNGRRDLENTLVADLKMALYRCRDARRREELYGQSLVPKAEQALEVAREGFEAGKVSFLDLVDAERTLLEFRLARERAFTDRSQRLAEVEMLVGGAVQPSQRQ